MFRSLWFRLTGTVFLVVMISMIAALIATLFIMRREFVDFVNTALTSLDAVPVEVEGVPLEIDEDLPEIIRRSIPDGLTRYTIPPINVTVPRSVQNEANLFLETTRDAVLIALSVSGGLAILASTWLFWQITRPMSKLRSAAEAVAGGDLQARVKVKSRDEVGKLGLAFNDMASELERQEGLRKQLVADVAHELRTPLSIMQGNLEAMHDGLLEPSPDELDGLHDEVLRLSRLVEDLRLLSLVDAGTLQLENEPVDVTLLIESAVRRQVPAAESRGVILTCNVSQPPATVMGDEDKLQQLLANLITNAIHYTPSGGEVSVSALSTDQVQVTVRDQGPGVDPADLPHLFERFWRGDRSRSRGGGGTGLGLSIVKQLVELHGGEVEAQLPPDGGLRVIVTLPAFEGVIDSGSEVIN
jgi:signal transduction histidine kinase